MTAVAFGAAGTKTGGLPTIDVTMDGSSISVTGTLTSGAVNVHSVATGQGSPAFVRLNEGVTANALIAFLNSKKASDANNVAAYGSIVFDTNADSSGEDVQTILQPGNYVAADTAGQPGQWATTTFTIAENGSPQKLPAAQQWQKSVEFRFRGQGTLHNGQVIRTSNAGFLVHMAVGFGVKSKAAGREAIRLLRAGKDNKIGKKLVSGGFFTFFNPVSHGAVQQFTLQMKPGWYVEACFMDTQDGREHTQLGMERLIHIVN
jgi:hypothetical protein